MIRASDLIGCRVQTESGRQLGKVHDLRAQADRDGWLLTGLIVGRDGLVARLVGGDGPAVYDGDVIPWQTIVRLHDGIVVVRDPPFAP
jgi:sporulation protein YlmC with PRC-barrel domain